MLSYRFYTIAVSHRPAVLHLATATSYRILHEPLKLLFVGECQLADNRKVLNKFLRCLFHIMQGLLQRLLAPSFYYMRI